MIDGGGVGKRTVFGRVTGTPKNGVRHSVTWCVASRIVCRDTHLCVGVLSHHRRHLLTYQRALKGPSFDGV